MTRRLFSFAWAIASVLSLVLCVGVCVLWARSYWVQDALVCTWHSGRAMPETAPGRFALTLSFGGKWSAETGECGVRYRRRAGPGDTGGIARKYIEAGAYPYTFWERRGVTYFESTIGWDDGPRSYYVVVAPCWPIALACAVLPAARAARPRAHSYRLRRRDGSCPACTYDLTGDRSGVCPECGTTIPVKGAS